ncbi:hypothetical protein LTR97_011658 [Elasticomyces elasticus]|uniref:Uncharacterized protein n=1 Tax=Elasticomyces elasticus TaxID=574655 RepID=A0AAN7VZ55_9PEZI|nr:hypothetical protein LTR49_006820 [Elasticomyces elasticus]KAK5691661.1 hypothetical protein LTR97_011658 [Elasticomyces elasticus]KAK5757279.1 hypothetical protein LTS12_012637 [Elasticomyces elasticus]
MHQEREGAIQTFRVTSRVSLSLNPPSLHLAELALTQIIDDRAPFLGNFISGTSIFVPTLRDVLTLLPRTWLNDDCIKSVLSTIVASSGNSTVVIGDSNNASNLLSGRKVMQDIVNDSLKHINRSYRLAIKFTFTPLNVPLRAKGPGQHWQLLILERKSAEEEG